jgi:hypothetical protein
MIEGHILSLPLRPVRHRRFRPRHRVRLPLSSPRHRREAEGNREAGRRASRGGDGIGGCSAEEAARMQREPAICLWPPFPSDLKLTWNLVLEPWNLRASARPTLLLQRSLHATQCGLSITQCGLSMTQCGLQMTKMSCQMTGGACQTSSASCTTTGAGCEMPVGVVSAQCALSDSQVRGEDEKCEHF